MKAVCEAKALAAPPVAAQRSVRPRSAGRICPTVPHRQQLRNAMLVRSTVADVETAELDAATPEQVDAAVAAPKEGTIAVNAETDQRSGSGRQGRQGNGRRAPRVSLESISVDQEMDGVVKNVADFGCFVDIGCGKDGLVHISQLSSEFVKDPREVVTAGQKVRVRVVSVDPGSNKIALTMRSREDVQAAQEARDQPREPAGEGAPARSGRERLGKIATRGGGGGQRKQGGAREKPKTTHQVGESLKAVVVTTTAYGAFVRLPDGTEALLHVSEMAAPADTVSPQARDLVKPEDEIEVRVVEIMSSGKVSVSQKSEEEAAQEKQMATGGMSSGVSTAGMSLLQAALARAGVLAETFATEDEKKLIEAKKAEKAAKKKPAKAAPAPVAAEQPSIPEDDTEPASEAEPKAEADEPTGGAVAAVADAAADVLPEPVASIAKAASDTITEDTPAAATEEEAVAESAPVEDPAPPAEEEPAMPEPAAEAAKQPAAAPAAEVEDVAATVEMPDEEEQTAAPEALAAEAPAESEPAPLAEEELGLPEPAAEASQQPAAAVEDVTATVEMPADEEATAAQDAVAAEESAPIAEAAAEEVPAPDSEAAAEPEPVVAAEEPVSAEEPSPEKDSEEPTSAIENAAEAAVDAAQTAADAVGSAVSKAVDAVASGAGDAAAQLADLQPAATPVFPPELSPEPTPEAAPEHAVAAAPDSSSSNGAAAPVSNGAAKGEISAKVVKELRDKSGAGMMQCKKALAEAGGDLDKAVELLRVKGLATADKKAGRAATEGIVTSYIHAGARLGVLIEVNCETDFVAKGDRFKELVADLAMQVAASPEASYVSAEDVSPEFVDKETAIEMEKEDILSKPEAIRPKIVQGRVAKTVNQRALLEQAYIKDSGKTVGEVVKEAIAGIGENIKIRRFERYVLGEGIEKKEADLSADIEEQKKSFEEAAAKKAAAVADTQEAPPAEAAAAPSETKPTVQVSAKVVKELREKSGAGMMDCKKALAECDGDLDAAADYLRKKGLASAGKKAGRVASEGAVGAYIHAGSRLGVLVEVNCETDFVARGERFQELVQDLAMQVAASSEVQVVALEDVSADLLAQEREIELQKEDLAKKPEAIREKMVEGRLSKIAKTLALMEQPFIKDSSKTVAEHIKEAVAGIGENIKIRRFTRYNLGEGLEKKESDFAAEVAAQTGQAA